MAASSFPNASRTAPSRPIAPISPVGQASVRRAAWKLPPAIAMAPRPYAFRSTTVTIGVGGGLPVARSASQVDVKRTDVLGRDGAQAGGLHHRRSAHADTGSGHPD